MYGTFRDQTVDEISAYLIEIFTFISIGDPRSRESLVFLWKVILLQNVHQITFWIESDCAENFFLSS